MTVEGVNVGMIILGVLHKEVDVVKRNPREYIMSMDVVVIIWRGEHIRLIAVGLGTRGITTKEGTLISRGGHPRATHSTRPEESGSGEGADAEILHP